MTNKVRLGRRLGLGLGLGGVWVMIMDRGVFIKLDMDSSSSGNKLGLGIRMRMGIMIDNLAGIDRISRCSQFTVRYCSSWSSNQTTDIE